MQIGHREEFLVLWKLFTVAILPLETQFIQPNYLVILSHLRSTTGSLETNSYIPLSQCPSPTLSTPPFCGNLVSQTENSEITVSSLLAKLSYWTFLGQAYFNLREKKDILSPVSYFLQALYKVLWGRKYMRASPYVHIKSLEAISVLYIFWLRK